MTHITTPVLDTALGRPAAAIEVSLLRQEGAALRLVATNNTDPDGRVRAFATAEAIASGTYQLIFAVAPYFERSGRSAFFERVVIEFKVDDSNQHYHVPLLLSPFGYSTYRGS